MNSPPRDLEYLEDINFYLFLETKERRKYEPWWYNFNLVDEGRTIQIWVPSNWKMRIPFSGKGCNTRCEDIMEGDPEFRLPTRVPILDFDVGTNEEMDDDHLIHNGEINKFEINDEENMGDDRVHDKENGLQHAPHEEV